MKNSRVYRAYKLFRYSLARRLPGAWGRYYERKFLGLHAKAAFGEALRRSEGKTCIDLGANVGIYTRKMAMAAKRVIAFEPDPWACAELRAGVADLENVTIVNAAAGVRDKKVLLYRHSGFKSDPVSYSTSSSVVPDQGHLTEEDAVEVRQIDFIRYLEALCEEIGVIKIDIEGAEVDLLESLIERPDVLARIDYIFAETHEKGIPAHGPRVDALYEKARGIEHPRINLSWP
ncbi:MAG: FkbM family methyltransferase [Nitrospinae bacterium]|nr:FkbM family methyltransferase [Nitrospinota bacterium]